MQKGASSVKNTERVNKRRELVAIILEITDFTTNFNDQWKTGELCHKLVYKVANTKEFTAIHTDCMYTQSVHLPLF